MNIKRLIFWIVFFVILGLIVWGLEVAMNKPVTSSILMAPAPVSSTDHVSGPADAPVTLIEYGDFECPACAIYAGFVERLMTEASTTVRVVFRHFPLPQHANAPMTAQASEAAAMQGKFWEMYKLLYAGQSTWESQSDADARQTIDGYAQNIGLDMIKFKADIDSNAAKSAVATDQADGNRIGIDQTPTFFINGKAIINPQNYEAFKALVEAAAR
jgi:protein-disulfide isomerase